MMQPSNFLCPKFIKQQSDSEQLSNSFEIVLQLLGKIGTTIQSQ